MFVQLPLIQKPQKMRQRTLILLTMLLTRWKTQSRFSNQFPRIKLQLDDSVLTAVKLLHQKFVLCVVRKTIYSNDIVTISNHKNRCKPYHRNAPIALKFAPTRKCYQNFRLLTCEKPPDFLGVFLRGRESGLEIWRKLRVVLSFGYWQKQGSNSEKTLKKPDLYAIMLL